MRIGALLMVSLIAASLPMLAQRERTRRANLTGSRGDRGKCTIEVVVDELAEVEIAGDMGRLRTLAGMPAEWRRFQCTEPLPANPMEFRFVGIDGRGRQDLVRDPRSTRGAAVVRIEDRKGGSEGYTFDLEWRGSAGGDSRYGQGGGGRDRRDSMMVSCSSDDMRRHYCDVDTRGGVRLLRQRSEAACREGYSWGWDRRGVWVDRGCRADFEVRR
jgi:hypothetical protein